MQPFVVEIVGGSSWWKDWLPLFSSVIVAAVAFRGVVLSNRTNSRAIERADAREHTKWQREALLNLCSESIERALVVQNGYAKMVFLPVPVEQERFDAALKNLEGQGQRIGANAAALRMLGAPDVASACVALYTAANSMALAATASDLLNARHAAHIKNPPPNAESVVESKKAAFDREFDKVEKARDELTTAAMNELQKLDAPNPVEARKWFRRKSVQAIELRR